MSQLSNAVSHGCVWLLVRFVECFEVWEFLTILIPKVEILKNTWNLGKIIHFYSCCNFWSRKATRTVDTALESWDLELFENKILGTIGVPYFPVKCDLWAYLALIAKVCDQFRGLFLGTMCNSMVPKLFRAEKYDVSAFKCRVACFSVTSRSICRMIWNLGVFDDFYPKSWNSQKNMKFGESYTFLLVL